LTCCSTEANSTSCWDELIGAERMERVLILQLRGEQRQEGVEVPGELLRAEHAGRLRGTVRRARGRRGLSWS